MPVACCHVTTHGCACCHMTAHDCGLLSYDYTWPSTWPWLAVICLHMAKHMAMACCFASNVQSHLTASHMFAWLSCSCKKLLKFHCQECVSKQWQEICMRLKHRRDEGSSGRQKKARISFEHLHWIWIRISISKWNWRYISAATNTSKRREISQSE